MDLYLSCTTGTIIALLIVSQIFRKGFDPFAPVWLFLMGYTQVYVVQAIMYREYALRVRGEEVVTAMNLRASGRCFGSWRSITAESAKSSQPRYRLLLQAGHQGWWSQSRRS